MGGAGNCRNFIQVSITSTNYKLVHRGDVRGDHLEKLEGAGGGRREQKGADGSGIGSSREQ